ncbi:MAG: C69 family dipeptidase [Niameybacter sp.]|uniref:C69 family dipeptidase n=1 Tax=Niameybacter sp. TaxID=2033640 RepID=UPI002FCC5C8A
MSKKNNLLKGLMTLFLSMAVSINVFACTGVVVGKDATEDGSIIIGRTEDIGAAYNKNFVVVPATTYKQGKLFEDLNGFKIEQPQRAYKYTMIPDVAEHEDGIYAAAGMNEQGVAMTATVSAAINDEIKVLDPLVETGIREAAIPSVVLPRIKTAREGVQVLGEIVEKHGSAEGNIILFADKNEAWYMEILSGHQWAAVKVPDDMYAVIPNAFMLGYIDLEDTKNVMASKDVINMPKEKGLLKNHEGKFHLALTYGTEMSEGNRLRAWGGQHFFSPSQNVALDTPAFDLFMKADDKIAVDEVMDLQRYRYEGTENDVNLPENKGKRAIGTEAQAECHIIQMKKEYPKEVGGLMWMAMGNAEHSVFLPTFGGITETHEAYKVPGVNYNQDAAYWTFRGLSTLAELDRVNYGKGVRDYWKQYELNLVKAQKAIDEKVIALAKTDQKAATTYMTEQGIQVAEDAITKAQAIHSQLYTFVAKHGGGRTIKAPFVPTIK